MSFDSCVVVRLMFVVNVVFYFHRHRIFDQIVSLSSLVAACLVRVA